VVTDPKFPTKSALRAAVAAGKVVRLVQSNLFYGFRLTRNQQRHPRPVKNGHVHVLGRNWSAECVVRDGVVMEVTR